MLALCDLFTYNILFSLQDILLFIDQKAEAQRSSFSNGTQLSKGNSWVLYSVTQPLMPSHLRSCSCW